MSILTNLLGSWFGRWNPRAVYLLSSQSSRRSMEAYEHDLVRAIIDTIATHAAKSTAMHIREHPDGTKEVIRNSPYARLINECPNEMMSGFDLKYKLISQLEINNNSMAYIKWDGVKPKAIYPVGWRDFALFRVEDGSWGVSFRGADGQVYRLPMEDVAMLRRHFSKDDVYGGTNDALKNILDTLRASDEGVRRAMDVSNRVRMFIKTKKSMLNSPKDKAETANEFAKRIEQAGKNGGVAAIDLTEDVQPVSLTAYTLNAAQMAAVNKRVMTYWRVNEHIITSDYTDNQYQAFYESVIEPRLMQLGQAFTNAAFTQAERDRGNKIIFVAPMLLHASTATKVQLIQSTKDIGLLEINEMRELIGYGPTEGGEKRLISLNYVDAANQNAYQGVSETKGGGSDESEQEQADGAETL